MAGAIKDAAEREGRVPHTLPYCSFEYRKQNDEGHRGGECAEGFAFGVGRAISLWTRLPRPARTT